MQSCSHLTNGDAQDCDQGPNLKVKVHVPHQRLTEVQDALIKQGVLSEGGLTLTKLEEGVPNAATEGRTGTSDASLCSPVPKSVDSPFGANIMREISELLRVGDHVKIPDYFDDNNESDPTKLPTHLKGLKVKLSEVSITREEYNLFIHEVLILPEGREEVFATSQPR